MKTFTLIANEVGHRLGDRPRGSAGWLWRGLVGAGSRRGDLFCLQALRFVIRAGFGVADRLGEHLAQFSLRHRWLPRDGCLPVGHGYQVGMPERELNPPLRAKEWRKRPRTLPLGLSRGDFTGVRGVDACPNDLKMPSISPLLAD